VPLTTLEPTPALVLIDLQKGIASLPTAQPAAEIIARGAKLAHAFRERAWPVVLVNVDGRAPGRAENAPPWGTRPPDWAELVPALERAPGDILITKQRWGAFIGTPLHDELRRRGVTQIVLGGISTSAGVESTARSAWDLGYHVVLVLDAMTDRDAESHRFTVERIFPRLGETTTTAELLAMLPAAH